MGKTVVRTVRIFALVVFLLAPLITELSARAQGQPGPVVIGERVQMHSNVLNDSRSLMISKPPGYDDGADRYPVLYLLDAETHFQYASGIVNFLGDNDRMPKMLVVGIDSGDVARRTRDLTTPSTAEIDNRFSPGGGGADGFVSFIADELIPYVEKNYRTRPYRLLVGHSFGGLFAVYALITRPRLFNAFIAADPSLDWNNQAVVAQAESFFSNVKELQMDLYVTAAAGSHTRFLRCSVERPACPRSWLPIIANSARVERAPLTAGRGPLDGLVTSRPGGQGSFR
jgi:predicted alpha/beta superfamily hydrolase